MAEGCPAEAPAAELRVMAGTGVGAPVTGDTDGLGTADVATGVGRVVGVGAGAGRLGPGEGRAGAWCRAGTFGEVAGAE